MDALFGRLDTPPNRAWLCAERASARQPWFPQNGNRRNAVSASRNLIIIIIVRHLILVPMMPLTRCHIILINYLITSMSNNSTSILSFMIKFGSALKWLDRLASSRNGSKHDVHRLGDHVILWSYDQMVIVGLVMMWFWSRDPVNQNGDTCVTKMVPFENRYAP
jgi:hypothetical protein